MKFLNWLFGQKETQRDRETDAHIEMVNIRLSIQREAEEKFNKAYNKLNDKEKKIADKHELKGFIFPTRGDWLDFKRYKCEELLEKRKK